MARHVLFVALAGDGHITPTLPLVEELVQRGDRVAYATAGAFADVVTGAGAQWVQLPPMAPFRSQH
jgi:UDP:flavonoid glycosyltransferase YjiC (YdhE family)